MTRGNRGLGCSLVRIIYEGCCWNRGCLTQARRARDWREKRTGRGIRHASLGPRAGRAHSAFCDETADTPRGREEFEVRSSRFPGPRTPIAPVSQRGLECGLGRQTLHGPSYQKMPKNQRTISNVNGTPSSQRMNAFPMVAPFFPAGLTTRIRKYALVDSVPLGD